MSLQTGSRIFQHSVHPCPRCKQAHVYELEISSRKHTFSQGVVVFGGKSKEPLPHKEVPGSQDARREPDTWDVWLTCPTESEAFVQSVSVVPDGSEEITGVTLRGKEQPAAPPDLAKTELTEWVKSSANNARDFCKTMMGAATGAIPTFFALLKYLGYERLADVWSRWLGIIPPVLFLAAAVIFVMALRPRYAVVDSLKDFEAFRKRRLSLLNRLIIIGTVLFALAVCLSIFISLKMLWQQK